MTACRASPSSRADLATWLQIVIGVISIALVAALVTAVYRTIHASPGAHR